MKLPVKSQVPSCVECEYREDSIFCTLRGDELFEISDVKTHNTYKKGQVIFYEGNHPQGLYCIYSGKVKVHKLGNDGREQIVRFAKRGKVLGYRSLLSGESYSASATALEDTKICYIPRTMFMELLNKNEKLSMETIHMLTSDLKFAEERIMNMAQKHVRERIAEALLMIKECYGLEEDSQTIGTVLTRRDIANVAGTTTETSIRILSDLNKENIIQLKGKRIKILDLPKLVKAANVLD